MRTTSRLVREDAARMAASPRGRTVNNLSKIRRAGLNAFGQPYTGNAIRGVGSRAPEADPAAELAEQERFRQAGIARAQAARKPSTTATTKPGGALIPGSSPGSAVWKSDAPAAPKPVLGRLASAGKRSANAANGLARARRARSASSPRFDGLTATEMKQRAKQGVAVFSR